MSKTNKVLFSLGISFNIVGALCILFSFIDDTFLCVATIPPTTKNVLFFAVLFLGVLALNVVIPLLLRKKFDAKWQKRAYIALVVLQDIFLAARIFVPTFRLYVFLASLKLLEPFFVSLFYMFPIVGAAFVVIGSLLVLSAALLKKN